MDFIFGWSTALFKDCTIHSLGDGYVTAPSTDQGKKYGYVFIGCKLTGVVEAQKVYLSRPWRPYAQAVFIHCDLGKHILPVGWNNWGKKKMRKPYSMLNIRIQEKGRLPLRVLRLESN